MKNCSPVIPHKKSVISLSLTILFILVLCLGGKALLERTSDPENVWYFSGNTAQKLPNLQALPKDALSGHDALMIVAHPDDETIWGADHLKNGNYVVVCITNGDNRIRRREFAAVMKQTGSVGLMLCYPDKTNGKRDNWKACRKQIQENIDFILSTNNWTSIATHNPKGEYGHIHHQMTSALTTSSARKENLYDRLYYFGTYVKAKNMEKEKYQKYLTNPLTEDTLAAKRSLTKLYTSQKKVMKHLGHMFPYENWTPAASAFQHTN